MPNLPAITITINTLQSTNAVSAVVTLRESQHPVDSLTVSSITEAAAIIEARLKAGRYTLA